MSASSICLSVVIGCPKERVYWKKCSKWFEEKFRPHGYITLEIGFHKREEEALKNQSEKMEIGWGSQIRSYVLHPYQMVKDHRNNCESPLTDKVLDGELEEFILEYLKWSNVGQTC